jgi:hypothetical protein
MIMVKYCTHKIYHFKYKIHYHPLSIFRTFFVILK